MATPIPITIVTGFLGSGKTTLILSLLPQLPKTYKLALLKNEFGNVATDSLLASAANIAGTTELLNGCICCNLVGQLGPALTELIEQHGPSRIVIETSGSAFPATLAMEVVRLGRETGTVTLDGVVVVIDCEEWKGYSDTSYTAKMQAKWTDLVVLNKWELAGERRVDDVLDRLGDLEVDIPIVRSEKGRVDMGVIFGVDSGLAKIVSGLNGESQQVDGSHAEHSHADDHQSEVDVLSIVLRAVTSSEAAPASLSTDALASLLQSAPKDEVYRLKAVLRCERLPASSDSDSSNRSSQKKVGLCILNWAFGRWTYAQIPNGVAHLKDEEIIRMTAVLARDCASKWKKKIESSSWFQIDGDKARALELQVAKLT